MTHEIVVHVPISALPHGEVEREEFLLEYFRDLLPTATRLDSQWEIVLERPDDPAIYIDPRLDDGLSWWGDVTVPSIFSRHKCHRQFLLSLHDNWTLFSWTHWLSSKLRRDGKAPSSITILHLDDHTDFMNPLLTSDEDGFDDLLTSKKVRLDDELSVRTSIMSGAIGVGSYMAPFLHQFENVTFLHLAQRNARNPEPCVGVLCATNMADQLLRPGVRRPSLSVRESATTNETRILGRYHKEFELDRLLSQPSDGPILLHIDMDYFNNRYDGDSDWRDHIASHDPPLSDIIALIQDIFLQLSSSMSAERIEDVAIGLSPGFFPAELWQSSVEKIDYCLAVASPRFSLRDRRTQNG